jgi:hypothetical protein
VKLYSIVILCFFNHSCIFSGALVVLWPIGYIPSNRILRRIKEILFYLYNSDL